MDTAAGRVTSIRMSDELRDAVRRAARAAEVPVSQWMRNVIAEAARETLTAPSAA